jgi:hypothetical protein
MIYDFKSRWKDPDSKNSGSIPNQGSPKVTDPVDTAPEPEFVNLLRRPGIDLKPGGLVQQPYLAYRPARLHRLAASIPGLLKRLQIWAQPNDFRASLSSSFPENFYRSS